MLRKRKARAAEHQDAVQAEGVSQGRKGTAEVKGMLQERRMPRKRKMRLLQER